MANTTLNASIIAKAAVQILENELTMANAVYRGYEEEFDKKVNGYTIGDTITIRKPADFTVRTGTMTASPIDVTEGKVNFQINKVAGVDFKFTTQQLTLNISQLSERVIQPALVQVANQIDRDVFSLINDVPQWVGTPGTAISTFAGLSKGPLNMDQRAVPSNQRYCAMAPSDFWSMAGAQTALFNPQMVQSSFRNGIVGNVAGLDTMMCQNVPVLTTGPLGGAPAVNGANQNTAYDTTGTNTQTLITNAWTAAAAQRVNIGNVFTIAGVFDVNPVTKAQLPFLKQFVVAAGSATSSDAAGNLTLTISPQIITSGPFQNVSAVPANGALLTFVGAANTGYTPSIAFHKNAFALCMVPLARPAGAVDVSRVSKNGISVRVIPYYDGVNDASSWRLDVLYGVKTIDPRLAVRVSGT